MRRKLFNPLFEEEWDLVDKDIKLFRVLFLVWLFSCFIFFGSFVSATSSIEVDLPNFCDTERNDDITVNFADYISFDFSKEFAICYVFSCTNSDGDESQHIRNPVCIKNGYASILHDYFQFTMNFDQLNLEMDSASGDKCVALFGLAECDWSYQNCYSVLFRDGQWDWLPSDRYNDVMNVHMVLEMNDGSFTEYMDDWGSFTGDYCPTSTGTPSGTVDLSTNLNAYFNFDNDASDGRGHSVVTYGDPDFTSSGILGNAYDGNASSGSYFIVSDLSTIANHYNWTYNYWIKGTSNYGFIFDAIDSTSNGDHISSYVRTSDDKLIFRTKSITLSTIPTTNNWRMVSIVHTDGSYKYYINGSLSFTSSYYLPIGFPSSFKIGSDAYSSNRYTGYLDELGFWLRSLDTGEILDLWNDGNGLTYDGFTFVADSPNYNLTLVNDIRNFTMDYLEESCIELDYYYDNWDYFNVTYYDPPTESPANISTCVGSLNGDYFEVGLGCAGTGDASRLCVSSYEKNDYFNLSIFGCDESGCIEEVVYYDIVGNYSSNVSSRLPFMYSYSLYPEDVSQSFSMNTHYGNYEYINLSVELDGSNRTFYCSKDEGINHTYDGELNYSMECDNDNVYFTFLLNEDSVSTFVYLNASNNVSSVTDRFLIIANDDVPSIVSNHSNVSIAYYDFYSDIPSDYFSGYNRVYVEILIPGTNNFLRLLPSYSNRSYTEFGIDYYSNGSLLISSYQEDYSFCVWYIAENFVGTNHLFYSVAISSDGTGTNFTSCTDIYGSVGYVDPFLEIEFDSSLIEQYFYSFGDILPSDVSDETKGRVVMLILVVVNVLIFSSLFRSNLKVALNLCVVVSIVLLFLFYFVGYLQSSVYPTTLLFLFILTHSLKYFGRFF